MMEKEKSTIEQINYKKEDKENTLSFFKKWYLSWIQIREYNKNQKEKVRKEKVEQQKIARENYLKKEEEEKKQKLHSEELKNHVNILIEAGLLGLVLEMQKNGYVLEKDELYAFNQKIMSHLMNAQWNKVEEVIKSGYVITNEILTSYLWNSEFSEDSKFFINKHYSELWKDKEWCNKLIKKIKNDLERINESVSYNYKILHNNYQNLIYQKEKYLDKDNVFRIQGYAKEIQKTSNLLTIQLFEQLQSTLSLSDYLECLKNVRGTCNTLIGLSEINKYVKYEKIDSLYMLTILNSEYISEEEQTKKTTNQLIKNLNIIIEKMTLQIETCFSEDKIQLLDKIKNNNMNSFINNKVIENSLVTIKTMSTNELPEDAKKVLNQIELKLKECIKDKELMNETNWYNIEIVRDKRLPEIIEKYLRFAPEYREEFRNVKGESAKEIMIDALKTVNEILNSYIEEINENKLSSLSATNRYTKALKNL